jgi:hypothetical protein
MTCGNCAYYVDNWFYGYQVYCANPTEYWLNWGGYVLLILLAILLTYINIKYLSFRK